MLEFIVYVLVWCFAIYGILVSISDVLKDYTYKKVKENVKLIMTVKDVEDGIENYIRDLSMGRSFYNNLVVIDLGSKDDTVPILKTLAKDSLNLKVLNKYEGIEYINNAIK